jgi:hypothetical protein
MSPPTDSALRSLDAAVATLTVGEQKRAAATLERIVATTPSILTGHAPAPVPPRWSRRRLVLLPTAALAVIVGSLVLQGLGGGNTAYASWTATPTAVTSDDLDAAAAACREKLGGRGSSIDMDRARLVLAERRGEIVAVLYRTEDPDLSGSCLVHQPLASPDADVLDDAVGGNSGPALKAPARGFTQGAISSSNEASITDGAVGEGVTGVTIHAERFTVNASVQNGRYAAWWPGTAFASGPFGPSGNGKPGPILTYDLTLTDGSVIHNAQPTRPS